MSTKATAARIYEYGEPDVFRFETMDVGHEVLVRNTVIGLNFVDIYYRRGTLPVPEFLAIIGDEASGIDSTLPAEGNRSTPRRRYRPVPRCSLWSGSDLHAGAWVRPNSTLSESLFCWYGPRVGIIFSPSDHNGIWAGRLEGVKGKGTLPAYILKVVERIAKEKGLA
jgi:hypothetical protein